MSGGTTFFLLRQVGTSLGQVWSKFFHVGASWGKVQGNLGASWGKHGASWIDTFNQ